MDYFRKLVSGKRRRFHDGNYDLDITYITPRVIAMSYPAVTVAESMYRNPAPSVVRFLKERHDSNFRIFNCSERTYDHSKLDGKVSDYNWKDHHAPPMHLLFNFVKEMYLFLKENDKNVIAVHCNSGKGRTGTGIASLLLFSGFVSDTDDALRYYGWKRFSSGIGVSQPCQLRYIYYFEAIYNKVIVAPTVKKLKAILCKSVPNIENDDTRLYVEVFHVEQNQNEKLIFTNRFGELIGHTVINKDNVLIYEFDEGLEPVVFGDMHFLFKLRGVMYDTLFCRIAFNTAFIPQSNTLNYNRLTVSPDAIKKDKKVTNDFMIQLVFEDYCGRCNRPNQMALDEFCDTCKEILKEDLVSWKSIQMVMQKHKFPCQEEGLELHQSSQSDKSTMLNYDLLIQSQFYKIKVKGVKDSDEQKVDDKEEQKDQFKDFDYNDLNSPRGTSIYLPQTKSFKEIKADIDLANNAHKRPVTQNIGYFQESDFEQVEAVGKLQYIDNHLLEEDAPEIREPDQWDS